MIAIGCDHGGFPLKKDIIKFLEKSRYEYKDYGTYTEESCDYPEYAKKVAHAVADGECEKGIIICGTGIGVCMTANKVKGVRAALVHDCFSAKATREPVSYTHLDVYKRQALSVCAVMALSGCSSSESGNNGENTENEQENTENSEEMTDEEKAYQEYLDNLATQGEGITPVSYTHLDVYKRQRLQRP